MSKRVWHYNISSISRLRAVVSVWIFTNLFGTWLSRQVSFSGQRFLLVLGMFFSPAERVLEMKGTGNGWKWRGKWIFCKYMVVTPSLGACFSYIPDYVATIPTCSCDTPSNNWWKKGAWWKLMIFISDTLHPISWGKWIFCKYMVVTPSLGACCSYIPDYVATIPTCSCNTPSNNWWKKGAWDLIK